MNQIIQFNRLPSFPELSDVTGFTAIRERVFTPRGDIIPQHYGIRKEDSETVLGVVGNKFEIANNGPIFEVLRDAVQATLSPRECKGVSLVESASYGGAFTRFELVFPELKTEIRQRGSETELNFKISVINGFAGNSAIRVMAGAYDLICTNGLFIGEMSKATARHTTGFTPARFGSFIEGQLSEYRDRGRIYQAWADQSIGQSQVLDLLEASKIPERKREAIAAQFALEAASRGATVWALYSALTFYASHNSERFTIRNSARVDNAAAALAQRELEVSKIVDSKAWSTLTARAA